MQINNKKAILMFKKKKKRKKGPGPARHQGEGNRGQNAGHFSGG